MQLKIIKIIFWGVTSSLVWFIAGSVLYMNPIVSRLYKNAESSPALKKWHSLPKYLFLQYLGICVQCVLWAFVFYLIEPALPKMFLAKGLLFGLILTVVKIIPRFFDMWIQSTYPNKLLIVELINGIIGSFIIGILFAFGAMYK